MIYLNKEEVIKYYIEENHTQEESSAYFGISKKQFYTYCNKNNIRKDRKKIGKLTSKAQKITFEQDFIDKVYNYYIEEKHTREDTLKHFNLTIALLRNIQTFDSFKKDRFIPIDNELLIKMYINDNKKLKECAEYFGVSIPKIRRTLRKLGIYKDKELISDYENTKKIRLDKEKLYQYYVLENHSLEETAQYFNVDRGIVIKNNRDYKFEKDKEAKQQVLERGMIEKHGVKSPAQIPEVRDKIKNTCFKRFGAANYLQSQLPQKTIEIVNDKDKFRSFIIENKLCTVAEISDALQYKSESNVCKLLHKYDSWDLIDKYSSGEEQALNSFISSIGVCGQKDRKVVFPYEIDILCDEYKTGLEMNGLYWHCSLKKDKNYHFLKSKMMEDKGFRLIHIYDYEWNDKRKRPIIESLLRITFGKVENKIYARNCEIREITNKEAKPFNEKNHLQGHRNAQITYGLFYKGELVQLMSFSKHKKYEWEIIRGCPGSNNIVVGGVSKLFNHFIKEHNPNQVFSYCDYNKFDGKGYEALGMKFIGYTGPDMKWIIDWTVVNRKPSKHKELKEKAVAQIWGAGSKKYLWTKPQE